MYDKNGRSLLGSNKGDNSYIFSTRDLQRIMEMRQQNPAKIKHIWDFPFMQNKKPAPYYTPLETNDETLIFESRFESGNLETAIKISETEYKLLMQNDSLTNGNTQWFYFKVSNTRKNKTVQFHILNFVIHYWN